MKIFRYYYTATENYPEAGFLIRLDDLFRFIPNKLDEHLKLVAIFEDQLKAPDYELYWSNTTAKSYFTLKGNRKFKKAINAIKKELDEKYHWDMLCICKDISTDDERIIYRDEYQLILKEDDL